MNAGVHQIRATLYHEDPCERPSLTASIARVLLAASPRHAWTAHPRLNPDFRRVDDEKFDVGSAAHALFLEGREAVSVIDADSWRTKDAKLARDAARADGHIPLLPGQWDETKEMVAAVKHQLGSLNVAPPVFQEGQPEQTLIWEDDGVLCRARLDWLRDDHAAIDDLKTTTRSANPESWARSMFNMGHDVQAAFYLRGIRALFGADAEFRFVVCETTAPYAVSVVSLAPDALALADDKVTVALQTWRRCLDANDWPAYPAQVAYAEAPPWAEAQWLQRDGQEAA